jgi:hypothetical protein
VARLSRIVLALIAFGSLANAVWMLAAPAHWYAHVPAEVPDFGPYNPHFVRDIGVAFLVIGLGLAWGLRDARARPIAVAFAAMFYGIHAAVHVYDTALGHVDAGHWLVDFPTTYLPAILLAAIWRSDARASAARTRSAEP